MLFAHLPSEPDRLVILEIHGGGTPLADTSDLQESAGDSPFCSDAELEVCLLAFHPISRQSFLQTHVYLLLKQRAARHEGLLDNRANVHLRDLGTDLMGVRSYIL